MTIHSFEVAHVEDIKIYIDGDDIVATDDNAEVFRDKLSLASLEQLSNLDRVYQVTVIK